MAKFNIFHKFYPYLIICVVVIGLFVRILDISKYPPSLNWDEVSIGYNAYSVLKTGKDEWNTVLPNIFRAYGDFKLPLYLYATIPFIAFLGLNTISVKLVSILSGTILIYAVYLLLKSFSFKNNHIPLIGALIIALSPWSFFLSRVALEANLFITLFIFSLYFIFKKNFNISIILFTLCLFSYNSARVLLPFYLFGLYLNRPLHLKSYSIIIFFLGFFLFLYQTFFASTGQSRYKLVSLIDGGTINRIESRRSVLSPIVGKIIHNKVTYFVTYSTINYLKVIDPRFLFFNGGTNYQFNIPYTALIYPIFIPFYFIGLIYLIKRKDQLLYWYLISPIPSAITRDAPHTLRAIVFLCLATIIIAIGFNKIKSKLLLPTIFIILIIFGLNYFQKYINYSKIYSWSWQYGYPQMVDYIKLNYSKYNHIYITKKYGEAHEFVLFNLSYDPQKYQNDPNKSWNYHADWYWVDRFDKFIFLNDWEVKTITSSVVPNSLLVTSPGNYPSTGRVLKTINFKDNTPAFDIVKL